MRRTHRSGIRVVLVAAVVMLSLAAGCSQSTNPDLDSLDGRWSWVSATGGIAGTTITPSSVGYTMTIEYDSQGVGVPARFVVLRNGQLFAETTVERSGLPNAASGTLRYRDPVLGWPEQEFQLTSDTLFLADGCCDGFSYRFKRAQ